MYASTPGRLRYLPIILIVLYWLGDLLGKYVYGPEFPVSPAIYASMYALAKYSAVSGALTIAVVFGAARAMKWEARRALGFDGTRWGRQALAGIGLGLGSFIVLNLIGSMLSQLIPRERPNPFIPLLSQRGNIVPWLLIVWLSSFVEELERVFVLKTFETTWARGGVMAGLCLSSVLFGVGHYNQGAGTAIAATLFGGLYGYFFIRRRKIGEVVLAHAVYDSLGILAAYFLYAK